MRGDTHVTPERTALKTARTVSASFVAVTNFTPAFFNGQHNWQTADTKVCGQILLALHS